MVRIAVDGAGWFSVDEIGFGPKRDPGRPSRRRPPLGLSSGSLSSGRLPPYRRRGFVAAASVVGAAVAAIAIAVTAAGAQQAPLGPPAVHQPVDQAAALPGSVLRPPSAVCQPARPAWPSLANLPAGLHAGAVPIVVDEQFSGQCPASAP
jgi:hypothetical protein